LLSHDAIFLSDGQVNQLIISVYLDRVQAVLELGTMVYVEAITLLSIGVSVIARVLTKVIESLGILEYGVGTLSKSQKFIQLPLPKPFWNMVGSEGILEFVPSDNMIGWEHGKIVVPPKARGTTKLLRGKTGLICIRIWHHKY
jgi:hypothetical protein